MSCPNCEHDKSAHEFWPKTDEGQALPIVRCMAIGCTCEYRLESADRTVDVTRATATVHRYYVEGISEIKCVGERMRSSTACESEWWWKYGTTPFKSIFAHVQETGHEVRFTMTDFCTMSPAGQYIAPDAADFLELRKHWHQ